MIDFSLQREIWLQLFAAAIANGKHTPDGAAMIADEALKQYNARHDVLGGLENEVARLTARLRVRTRQAAVGTQVMMVTKALVEEIDRRFQGDWLDGEGKPDVKALLLSGWLQELRDRLLPQLHVFGGGRLLIVPHEFAAPKDGDAENDLIPAFEER